MISLSLDGQGRPEYFMAVPPDSDSNLEVHPDPDWSALFAAAGLKMSDFGTSEPSSIPRTYCQQRRAWRGGYPEQERYEMVVEACELAGRPVYFEMAYPWSERDWEPAGAGAANIVRGLLLLVIVVACAVLARRHLRSERRDRRGAIPEGVQANTDFSPPTPVAVARTRSAQAAGRWTRRARLQFGAGSASDRFFERGGQFPVLATNRLDATPHHTVASDNAGPTTCVMAGRKLR